MHLSSRQVENFRRKLRNWYHGAKRDMPWRSSRDPYRIWVSEVMLQQTQVKKVVSYYLHFIEKFPDIPSLAAASTEEVLKSWELLGYYARARNLHKSARIIMEKHRGKIPADYETFLKLPGVGPYIAAAVMSIAFQQPFAVLDGNVKRVLARIFKIGSDIRDTETVRILRKNIDILLDRKHPADFNQGMMELGAVVCRPFGPDCKSCPVSRYCQAFQSSQTEEYPVKSVTRKIPEYNIALGIVQNNNRILITRRPDEGLLGGLWEFPGGKVKENEASYDACKREIKEEVNLEVRVDEHLAKVRHAYSHFRIVADVYLCRYNEGEVLLDGPVDYRWVKFSDLEKYPFPALNHKIFRELYKKIEQV